MPWQLRAKRPLCLAYQAHQSSLKPLPSRATLCWLKKAARMCIFGKSPQRAGLTSSAPQRQRGCALPVALRLHICFYRTTPFPISAPLHAFRRPCVRKATGWLVSQRLPMAQLTSSHPDMTRVVQRTSGCLFPKARLVWRAQKRCWHCRSTSCATMSSRPVECLNFLRLTPQRYWD